MVFRTPIFGNRYMACYIWYSEEESGRGRSPPRRLFPIANVTANPSTALPYCCIMVRCSAVLMCPLKS